jgi:biotin transport system substrate-specific component
MNSTTRLVPASTLSLLEGGVLAQLFWVVVFAVATAAGARFEIAHQPVPYTLQTLAVLLSGAFLGPRNGALSQIVYLGAGALGAPVFATGAFGPLVLFGPTGGYLLAFPAAAALVGFMTTYGRSLPWIVLSMACGLLLVFASGTLYLNAVALHDLRAAFSSGFLLFSWWDLLKLATASAVYHQLARRWPRLPRDGR